MQKYEQMRKDRLEEHKKKDKVGGGGGGEDEEEGEVHRATTIYHGVGGDQSGKGWVDPPGYLRQKEHACFIPKKFVHTYAGHDKGV
jgi:hypothetical protein